MNNYRMCTKCVMDTTDPDIFFDEKGVCNHCNINFPYGMKFVYTKDPRKLNNLVKKIKKKGKNKLYDAVMGISGGTDSSYTAYTAHKLGLRVHLINLNNGYDTPEAQHNVKKIAEYTGFPIEYLETDWNEFRDVQLAYLKAGVMDIEAPTDHFIRSTVIYFAKEKEAKFWLTGSNIVTEGFMPKAWGVRNTDTVNIKKILKKHGTMTYKTLPFMNIWKYKWYETVKGIKRVPLLNYVDYNRAIAQRQLSEECGWKDYGLKHSENVITRFFQNYILPKRWNIDRRLPYSSVLINSGQMGREEALKVIKEPLYTPEQYQKDKKIVLERLRISEEEFDEFMESPCVPHRKFGTHYWQLILATAIFNPLSVPKKASRVLKNRIGNTLKR